MSSFDLCYPIRLEACSFDLYRKRWLVYIRYACLLPIMWGEFINNGFESFLNDINECQEVVRNNAYQRAKALIAVKMLAGKPAAWDDQRLIIVSYADIVAL